MSTKRYNANIWASTKAISHLYMALRS